MDNSFSTVEFGCNEVAGVCHEDAECVYDVDDEKYKCQCNDGYSGDGVSCERSEIGWLSEVINYIMCSYLDIVSCFVKLVCYSGSPVLYSK